MKSALRLVSLMLFVALVLGLVLPAAAQDSMKMLAAPDCNYGGEFKSIEVVDQYTVKFTLCYPDPGILAKLALATYSIQSSEYLEKTGGGGEELLNNPIGTGPYMLEKWDKGNEIVFARNDNYWGEKPIAAKVILRWNVDSTARLNELLSGNIDGFDNVAPGDFAVVQGNPDLQLVNREPVNIFYLGLNNTKPPFDNEKVRQAIAYGLNRQRIIDNFYPAGSQAAGQFMPPTLFGHVKESQPFPYDPEMAKKLLAESGVTLPIETTLSYRDVVRLYLPSPGIVGQDIQAQLKDIGINITLNVVESGAFIAASTAGEYPMFMLGWGADYADATNFVDFHFGKGSSPRFGEQWPEVTSLLEQAAQLSDPAKRVELYGKVNDLLRDHVPMVPIAHGASATAYRANVKNAYAGAYASEQFGTMDPGKDTLIFMQGAEPISLYCPDESDGETFRACEQINESLLSYELGGGKVLPGLAAEWSANPEATEWTFKLRQSVKFTDGSDFDATDVMVTFAAYWDAAHPLHTGHTATFDYFKSFFGEFLNAPKS